MQRFSLTKTIVSGEPATACEFLASHTVLSKNRIKDAMAKGAVWIKKTRGKQRRIRRATAALRAGDILSVNDDAGLLALAPLRPDLVSDQHRYSVWYKPAGLMTQGTRFGDHCSLLRQAELFFKSRRDVFPVHRLDREAAGIVILAVIDNRNSVSEEAMKIAGDLEITVLLAHRINRARGTGRVASVEIQPVDGAGGLPRNIDA